MSDRGHVGKQSFIHPVRDINRQNLRGQFGYLKICVIVLFLDMHPLLGICVVLLYDVSTSLSLLALAQDSSDPKICERGIPGVWCEPWQRLSSCEREEPPRVLTCSHGHDRGRG